MSTLCIIYSSWGNIKINLVFDTHTHKIITQNNKKIYTRKERIIKDEIMCCGELTITTPYNTLNS